MSDATAKGAPLRNQDQGLWIPEGRSRFSVRTVVGRLRRRVARLLLWIVEKESLLTPRVYGDAARVSLGHRATINDAILNAVSGRIEIGDGVFFGHGVQVLTGTHDWTLRGDARQAAVPTEGRDVVIGPGAWVGSAAIVIGPCTIGADAVVCAGAVVTKDVPADAIVAGVPARVIAWVDGRSVDG